MIKIQFLETINAIESTSGDSKQQLRMINVTSRSTTAAMLSAAPSVREGAV